MKKKVLIIIFSCLILVISIFIIIELTAKKSDGLINKIPAIPKKYESNEYYKLNISKQELCTIYLNDYISLLSTDMSTAYNLLDEEYKNIKFPTYIDFENYINNIYSSISSINKYKISGQKYYIYDKNDNLFIFVTNGVMNYKVYLDDYTTDITNYDR